MGIKKNRKIVVLAGVAVLGLLILLMRGMVKENVSVRRVIYEPVNVTHGKAGRVLELRGILQSTKRVPVAVMTHGRIQEIAPMGSEVKKGDPLVMIDDSEARERIENNELNLNLTEMDLVQVQFLYELTEFNENNNVELFRKRLEHARLQEQEELASPDARRRRRMEIEERLALLDVEDAEDTYQRELKMYEKKYISYTALEPYLRSLENARATLEELRLKNEIERKGATEERRVELRKAVERAKANLDRVGERRKRRLGNIRAQIESLKKTIEIHKFNMARAQLEVNQALTRAPEDGVFMVRRVWDSRAGGIVREIAPGDERWRYDVVGFIIDPSSMRVNFAVNEADRAFVREGQPVTVTFPALPGKRYSGKVSSVGSVGKERNILDPTVTGGGRSEITVFNASLDFVNDGTVFRPGMSARVRVESSAAEDGIFLPREAVYSDEDGYYVLKGSSHAVVRVKGKPHDELYFLVEQGVDEGDTVFVRKSLMQ